MHSVMLILTGHLTQHMQHRTHYCLLVFDINLELAVVSNLQVIFSDNYAINDIFSYTTMNGLSLAPVSCYINYLRQ